MKKQKKLKSCTSDYVSAYVNSNFNVTLFKDLPSGRYRVAVMYAIDIDGRIVDVKSRGPYRTMEKEAIRVIKSLSPMNPGYKDGKPVKLTYGLPINCVLTNDEKNNKKQKN